MMSRRGLGVPITAAHLKGMPSASASSSANIYAPMRPPTASIGPARPGSALKRLPTAAGQPVNVSGPVGLTTDVQVAARPVTQQGLTGMKTRPLGPGRQLADKSYYLLELRKKKDEITKEIESMKKEGSKLQRDTAKYARLERQYETSASQVRELEGQLADINLALDKLRTNTDVGEIIDMYEHLKERNDEERQRIDQIFLKRQQGEEFIAQVEAELERVHQRTAQNLAAMGDDLRQEYDVLQQQSAELDQAIQQRQDGMMELDNRIRNLRQQLKSDAYQTHTRGMELLKRREQLLRKQAELEEETSENLTPEQIRERLLAKVKQCNGEIKETQQAIDRVQDEVDTAQEKAREREEEIESAKKHAAKASKYEALYERDRKMQEFLDKFDDNMREEAANMDKLQRTIVALLEHISKGINLSQNLPSQERLSEMREELSFKAAKMKSSEATLQHIRKDLEQRRADLEKINTLDKKIGKELVNLKSKMASMREEQATFRSADELRAENEQTKQDLIEAAERYRHLWEQMKLQVQQLSVVVGQQQRELASNETMKKLDAMMGKLRTHAQTVYTLSSYIAAKERDSDFKSVAEDISGIVKELNTLHQQPLAPASF
eukprot:TRINITY_DN68195_c1_g1_i4.p1 TRINITY_DN68195_c1_g1~~TRINITY_DN68195_c1_g1_i4.p1  ORF type:complete len:610 (-),score=369.53 TRINITY_DN68195_c1_g1_i4:47-1876(-)